MHVKQAFSDLDLVRCFPIMLQLRPHLTKSEFTKRVLHQQKAGYSLVYLEENGTIKAVAGFRILEKLSDGRQLYVDDLITNASERYCGYGSALLDWLVEYAKSQACSSVQLDSGVQRAEAHRFYFRNRMKISAFHFNLSVNSPDQT